MTELGAKMEIQITSRERVNKALNFEPTDRVPRDLSGMRSTGISCFAYPKLVAALGLPPRWPRVYDTGQMLALPNLDVFGIRLNGERGHTIHDAWGR